MTQTIDLDAAWAAFDARDRAADGRFVVAVKTTGIYCKPSCPARRPRRENVSFHPDGAAALIGAAEEGITLAELAAEVGYAPTHFQRVFTRALGVSPAAYARGVRAERAATALKEEASVTEAIYEAGYSGPSRFYAETGKRLGMAPGAWARGGAGATIRWTVADTSLGPLLVAATDKGLCRVSFDEDERTLRARFPRAGVERGGAALDALAAEVVALVERPGEARDLPLDVRGTAFQERVWAALKAIPPGETRTYAELAAEAGNPRAVRAAGSACGANHLAVVIPCHRALRSDGSLGGYAYGLERKRALMAKEGR